MSCKVDFLKRMNRETIAFVAYILLSSQIALTSSANVTNATTARLPVVSCASGPVTEKDLFDNYLKRLETWVRPVKNSLKPINVEVSVMLSGIYDILEKEGVAMFIGFLDLTWHNEVHVWNKSFPQNCIESLHLPENVVWLPDLAILTSKYKYDSILSGGHEKIRLFSNGTVNYRPGGMFDVYCLFDLSMMPFDEQVCRLEFESWGYATTYQTLSFGKPAFATLPKVWIEHEQWHFSGYRISKSRQQYGNELTYDHLTYEFILKRKTGYYWTNVIFPSMVISVAQLTVFTLPVDEVLKLHLSFTCLLAYGVFQLMIVDDIPRSSDGIPLISIYIGLSMGFICLTILGEGFVFTVLELANEQRERERKIAPRWIMQIARISSILTFVTMPEILRESEEQYESSKHYEHLQKQTMIGNRLTFVFGDFVARYTGTFYSIFLDHKVVVSEVRKKNRLSSRINGNNRAMNYDDDDDEDEGPTDGEAPALFRDEDAHRMRHYNNNKHRCEWLFLADVIERLIFIIYALCTFITPTVLFGVIPGIIPYWKPAN